MAIRSVNTLVIGSGAAALKAAVSLHALGQRDILVITERWGGGTSANAGSDKQTYYRLSLSGDVPDSARALAEDLFAGGCMHGDIALAEAQHSAQAFYHLVSIGVPFPHDTYGGFPGYRTDHDTRGRGTSAGPSTSRQMVEALSREARERGIAVLDRHQAVRLLVDRRGPEARACGCVALDLDAAAGSSTSDAFLVLNAGNVVLGTGGPGAMYADSVYPTDQAGSIGMALAAGAPAQNLTESQFGLASIAFRWNVSGSYQQVVPRYVSTDAHGHDDREFLNEWFPDATALSRAIFRKGYQWPFDPRKVSGHGSSLIDLLVYRERVVSGRRVFLDFTRNFGGGHLVRPYSTGVLDPEAHDYLARSHALGSQPIDRLRLLNPLAIDLYLDHGIDLSREPLEIAVCAQHNNGGLVGNHWWESPLRGLYPVGEVNGSHGVYRPGGSALNAGQVGGLRAAMHIAKRSLEPPLDDAAFLEATREQVDEVRRFADRSLALRSAGNAAAAESVSEARRAVQRRMSEAAAHIRVPSTVERARQEAWDLYATVRDAVPARDLAALAEAFRDRDLVLAHAVYLEALAEYIARGGGSRGSYLVLDEQGSEACPPLGDAARFGLTPPDAFVSHHVLEVRLATSGLVEKGWTSVRPIPDTDTWFESVWTAFRNDEVVR